LPDEIYILGAGVDHIQTYTQIGRPNGQAGLWAGLPLLKADRNVFKDPLHFPKGRRDEVQKASYLLTT
jgi:hypothetical protein